MSKLLFVHGSEKARQDVNGNLYTDGSYPSNVWDRYKVISDDITVMFRLDNHIYSEEEAKKKYNLLDKKIGFIELIDRKKDLRSFISIKIKKENGKKIEKAVSESDYIIARIPSDEAYIAINFALKYRKKFLVEVVGCPWDSMWNYGIKGKILAPFSYFKLRKYTKKSPYLVYVSNRFLQERYPSNGKQICCSNVILNEINVSYLSKRLDKIKKRNNKDTLIIGTLGGIDVTFKGQQYMIKAINLLKKKGINVEYQVVGAGTGDKLTKLAIKENVLDNFKIIGSIPHNKIYDWLNSIDIYVQPSNQEGLCRSIIEAMSCACPVIASNAGGNSELINNSFIFKKKNVKQLVNRIEKMNSAKVMENEAINNFNNSKEYDIEILTKRREEFFKKFIKE